jgi:signal transduction histidine kinase
MSDVKKLSKIVCYLLENAIKFTSEGSIHIGFNEVKKKKVVIYVKDSGIGISKEQQQVIFGRFVQVEELMSRKFGGMGLGLAIARENAILLGGNIYVESELGKGSTFFVSLPA